MNPWWHIDIAIDGWMWQFVADVQGPQKVQGGARRQQDLGGRLLPSAHREPGHRRVRSLGLVEEETAAEGMFTSFFI